MKPYFLPKPSGWPLLGSLGLFCFVLGIINIIHGNWYGHYLLMGGGLLLAFTMFGWFSAVIQESLHGLHNPKMDRTYRFGMIWFITSEVAFFGIFFIALFYIRMYAVPELGQNNILWPEFQATWPLLKNPNPTAFPGPHEVIKAFGIPALNTLILLMSALMLTIAHKSLLSNHRKRMNIFLIITILLGLLFLGLQAYEYTEAYTKFNLTLRSGIYGSTFFMLTGFHGVHVIIGLTMLTVILIRCLKGHFTRDHDFGFEAVSWYWHFVDVIWLFLFIFVYWL